MNRMTKKRVGMVLAFSLTLTGAAAYIGIQQGNTDKTEAAGSLTAGVSASLNASEVEALDVTAGVTSQLYDKTDVAVAANEKQMVAQGIQRAHFETSHLQYNDENSLACVIALAYYSAKKNYVVYRELAGKRICRYGVCSKKNDTDTGNRCRAEMESDSGSSDHTDQKKTVCRKPEGLQGRSDTCWDQL